jgi:hypothetical protein
MKFLPVINEERRGTVYGVAQTGRVLSTFNTTVLPPSSEQMM